MSFLTCSKIKYVWAKRKIVGVRKWCKILSCNERREKAKSVLKSKNTHITDNRGSVYCQPWNKSTVFHSQRSGVMMLLSIECGYVWWIEQTTRRCVFENWGIVHIFSPKLKISYRRISISLEHSDQLHRRAQTDYLCVYLIRSVWVSKPLTCLLPLCVEFMPVSP